MSKKRQAKGKPATKKSPPNNLSPRKRLRDRKPESRVRKRVTIDELIAEDVLPSPDQFQQGRVSSSKDGDQGRLLTSTNSHEVTKDLRLINSATRKGWNVKRKNMIRRRMEAIVSKTTAEVVTREGIVSLESKADELAIRATQVLVNMDNADDAAVRGAKPENPGVVINNNVNNFDARRIELAHLAHKLGARELLIEGRSVPIAELLGPATAALQPEGEVQEPADVLPPHSVSEAATVPRP